MKLISCLPFLLILISGCRNNDEEVSAKKETITESVYASGFIKSLNQYQIYPAVGGIISSIPVTEGQIIKKGDPLIIIKNETARLNNENARLAAEYSSFEKNEDKLREIQLSIDFARSKMENDSLLFSRQQKLYDQNIGSLVELEQRRLVYESSRSALDAARLRYRDLKKQIDFTSKQSRKNLEIATEISDDYIIRSEIDGKVYSIFREKGEMVNPQVPVALIGDEKRFILEMQVDEYDISKIKTGQRISVSMDSYKDQVFSAQVTRINPLMNERLKSFTVEGEFINQPPELFPSLTLEANIIIVTKKDAITIPRDYLVNDSFVFISDKEKKKVTTGLRDYQKVEILDGLSEGEKIIRPE